MWEHNALLENAECKHTIVFFNKIHSLNHHYYISYYFISISIYRLLIRWNINSTHHLYNIPQHRMYCCLFLSMNEWWYTWKFKLHLPLLELEIPSDNRLNWLSISDKNAWGNPLLVTVFTCVWLMHIQFESVFSPCSKPTKPIVILNMQKLANTIHKVTLYNKKKASAPPHYMLVYIFALLYFYSPN